MPLEVRASEAADMFKGCEKLSVNLLLCNPTVAYAQDMFAEAATADGTVIQISYNGNLGKTDAERLLGTASPGSHVYLAPEVKPLSATWTGQNYVQMEVGETYEFEIIPNPIDATCSLVRGLSYVVNVDGGLGENIQIEMDKYFRKMKVTALEEGMCYQMVSVADGFFSGEEFENRGLNDRKYVETLYATFFNREAAETDINYWIGSIEATSRRTALVGFANSEEFGVICENYGIVSGEIN